MSIIGIWTKSTLHSRATLCQLRGLSDFECYINKSMCKENFPKWRSVTKRPPVVINTLTFSKKSLVVLTSKQHKSLFTNNSIQHFHFQGTELVKERGTIKNVFSDLTQDQTYCNSGSLLLMVLHRCLKRSIYCILCGCLPVLGFQALLQLLLTEHGMFPPQGLLEAWLGLQSLLVTQHWVVVFPKHLVRQQEQRTQTQTWIQRWSNAGDFKVKSLKYRYIYKYLYFAVPIHSVKSIFYI